MKNLTKTIVAEIGEMKQILCAQRETFVVPKRTQKFIGDMLSGMIAKGSVLLSEVARYLDEPMDLIQTEKRLSRQLNQSGWNVLEMAENYLQWAKQSLNCSSVIAFDLGDISKEYARKSPRLGWVWDGSKKKVTRGWWMIKLVSTQRKKQILPLFNYLFHTKSKRYRSHNTQVKRVLEFIVGILKPIGIWTFDRGFDDLKHFLLCTSLKLKFIVRINGPRHLIPLHQPNLKKLSVQRIARLLSKNLQPIAFVPVQLPETELRLTLVIRFHKKRSVYFLSNLKVQTIEDAKYVLRCYKRRWSVEDSDRAHKQIFDLENIRSRTWKSLNRLVHLSTWAQAVLFLISLLPKHILSPILKLIKRFEPPKQILYYRLADAVSLVLLLPLKEILIFG